MRVHTTQNPCKIYRAHKGAVVLDDADILSSNQRQSLTDCESEAKMFLQFQEMDMFPTRRPNLCPQRCLVSFIVLASHVVHFSYFDKSSSACYVFLSQFKRMSCVPLCEGAGISCKHVFLVKNEKMSNVSKSLLKFCFTHDDGLHVPPRKLHEDEILYPSQTMMMRQRASPGTRSNEARTCQRIMGVLVSILKIAAHTQDLRSHSKTLREKRWPQRALTVTCSRSSVCGWSLAGEVVKITESRSSSGKHPAIFNATSLFSLKMRNLGRQGTRVSLRAHQGGASLSPFIATSTPPPRQNKIRIGPFTHCRLAVSSSYVKP